MARQIDPSKSLDEDDRRFLRDRPWMIAEYRRQGFGDEMDAVEEDKEFGPKPAAESLVNVTDVAAGSVPHTRSVLPDGVTADDDTPVEPQDNYDSWTKEELASEIEERNEGLEDADKMSKSGTKSELIERLRQYDTAEDQG